MNVFLSYLSKDEIQRANEFVFEYLRNQFIICRGMLRKILSTFLKVNPAEIKFIYSAYGKPEIAFPQDNKVHFNVSHSGDFFIIAVSDFSQLGIDIEYCKQNIEILEIAKEVYTPNEILKLSCLPTEQQILEFYNMWTIKESYIKAIGKGFSFDPKWIEIDEDSKSFKSDRSEYKRMAESLYFSRYFFHTDYAISFVTPFKNTEIILHT